LGEAGFAMELKGVDGFPTDAFITDNGTSTIKAVAPSQAKTAKG
jgi:hypothetical protein